MTLPELFRGLDESRSFYSSTHPVLPKLSLELLLPFFLHMFTLSQQCGWVKFIGPVLSAVKHGNKVTYLTENDIQLCNFRGGVRTYTSFKSFNKGGTINPQSPSEIQEMLEAFMILSFCAKCTQLACVFGLLVSKTLPHYQMTYEGEHIIGWAVQDGYLKRDHANCLNLHFVKANSAQELPHMITRLKNGEELPGTSRFMHGDDVHVWLTFVTESGRIFDLDLSAFQFGIMDPLPYIIPVLNADKDALGGLCYRDRILSGDKLRFEENIADTIGSIADLFKSDFLKEQGITEESMIMNFMQFIDAVMHPRNAAAMPYFTTSERFWRETEIIELP
jgi:hypothetical protein